MSEEEKITISLQQLCDAWETIRAGWEKYFSSAYKKDTAWMGKAIYAVRLKTLAKILGFQDLSRFNSDDNRFYERLIKEMGILENKDAGSSVCSHGDPNPMECQLCREEK